MTGFTEMTVDSIRVHMPTGNHVVILRERSAERYLPIWIGNNEANAIALRITGITPDRPITHDLLCNVLASVDISVDRIVVSALSNDVFFARIVAKAGGRDLDIDARPSDAIAVAVRVGAAIYVADDVLEKAAVLPDAEGSDEGSGDGDEEGAPDESRLAIFRDMVNQMELPDLGGEAGGRSDS